MHLSKLPSGSWRVEVSHHGQRRTRTARTRGEAQQAGAELLLELGATPKANSVTVDELVGAWLAATVLSATYRADALRVAAFLPETFAKRRLVDVTPAVVEHLYRQLAADGYSEHRVRRAHAVLSSAWTLAMRYEWATTNPFRAARKPVPPRRKVHAPDVDTVTQLLGAADDRFRLYLRLSATIGARRGEMVALQWTDVAAKEIRVSRSLAYTTATGVIETPGKIGAKGHRVVAIPASLGTALTRWRKQQVTLAVRAGLPAPIWVFSHDAGVTPWRPDYTSRRFRQLCTTTGITGVRLHDLRHFMASEAIAAGMPLSVVGDRLGQTNRATTADTYGHLVPAADRKVADVMGRLLGG